MLNFDLKHFNFYFISLLNQYYYNIFNIKYEYIIKLEKVTPVMYPMSK